MKHEVGFAHLDRSRGSRLDQGLIAALRLPSHGLRRGGPQRSGGGSTAKMKNALMGGPSWRRGSTRDSICECVRRDKW